MPHSNNNKNSRKEQHIPDTIVSKICKNEERRVNIEFGNKIEEEIGKWQKVVIAYQIWLQTLRNLLFINNSCQ